VTQGRNEEEEEEEEEEDDDDDDDEEERLTEEGEELARVASPRWGGRGVTRSRQDAGRI